jgi:hypothetical protein
MGILQLLEKMTIDITGTGIDYAELFESATARKYVDLMLLSVPDVCERVAELAAAAPLVRQATRSAGRAC